MRRGRADQARRARHPATFSRSRSSARYTIGVVYRFRNWLIISPPTMVTPSGRRGSELAHAQHQRQRAQQAGQVGHDDGPRAQHGGAMDGLFRRQALAPFLAEREGRPAPAAGAPRPASASRVWINSSSARARALTEWRWL